MRPNEPGKDDGQRLLDKRPGPATATTPLPFIAREWQKTAADGHEETGNVKTTTAAHPPNFQARGARAPS